MCNDKYSNGMINNMFNEGMSNNDQDCCKRDLRVDRLSAKCVNAKCIRAHDTLGDKICAQRIDVKHLAAENEVVNNLCVSGEVNASQVWADKSYSNSLCAQSGTIGNLCVTNLNATNVNFPVKYRAAATYSSNTVYTLGQPLNWNIVLDDPNSNVTLSPFLYTVPVSGYYLVTFHMDISNLSGAAIISGTPVGKLELFDNGNELRSMYSPFLSFSGVQETSFTTMSLLAAGDQISMNYNVLVFDAVNGLVPYVGTVLVGANGTFPGESGFAIHFLSGLAASGQPPIVCEPCPIVTIGCKAVTTPCLPLQEDSPCDGC